MTRRRRAGPLAAAMAALLLAAVPAAVRAESAPSGLPRTLTPLPAQTSDEVIARDLAAIDGWQAKLDSLPAATADEWRTAAAKAWLEAARIEYSDDDRTGFPQAAFEHAVRLISDLEASKAPVDSANAPPATIPRGSLRVADSLYARMESLKHNPGFRCARAPLAEMEVELAWAGNEQVDQGECRVQPHLARAAELARQAEDAVVHCLPPPAPAKEELPVPVPQPDTVAAQQVPTEEELQIPRNVHFAVDKADLSPTSRQVIAGIAALLAKYPSITARLVGYTDSRGSAEYNLALSRRRVEAVKAELTQAGVDSARLATDYRGKTDLYALEESKRGYALNRRVEMVFVDAQGRDIKAAAQEGDLQLEQTPAKKPAPSRRAPKPATPAAPGRQAPARADTAR